MFLILCITEPVKNYRLRIRAIQWRFVPARTPLGELKNEWFSKFESTVWAKVFLSTLSSQDLWAAQIWSQNGPWTNVNLIQVEKKSNSWAKLDAAKEKTWEIQASAAELISGFDPACNAEDNNSRWLFGRQITDGNRRKRFNERPTSVWIIRIGGYDAVSSKSRRNNEKYLISQEWSRFLWYGADNR